MNRPAFRWLWASDALSVFGTEITLLALPLTAALWLQATPSQMGALIAAEMLPYGLLSLHAGALVDRCPKLPLLRAAALARALVLVAVPLLGLHGGLTMPVLYAVAFVGSCLAAFADPAYQALLPQVVPREALVPANARLGLTQSAAGIVAPGLAGLLAQALGAPVAVAADSLAVLAAGLSLGRIRVHERLRTRHASAPLARDIADGLAIVWRDPALRWTTLLLGAWQLLKHAFLAVFLLYGVKTLGLGAERIGVVMSMAGVGFAAASIVLPRLQERIGLGPAMLAGLLLTTLAWAAAALAGARTATALLALAMAGEGFGAGLFFLGLVSLRQLRAPPEALARVVTSMRFLTIGATPLGALLGGWVAEQAGLRAAVALAAAAGTATVLAAVAASPLRRLRQAA